MAQTSNVVVPTILIMIASIVSGSSARIPAINRAHLPVSLFIGSDARGERPSVAIASGSARQHGPRTAVRKDADFYSPDMSTESSESREVLEATIEDIVQQQDSRLPSKRKVLLPLSLRTNRPGRVEGEPGFSSDRQGLQGLDQSQQTEEDTYQSSSDVAAVDLPESVVEAIEVIREVEQANTLANQQSIAEIEDSAREEGQDNINSPLSSDSDALESSEAAPADIEKLVLRVIIPDPDERRAYELSSSSALEDAEVSNDDIEDVQYAPETQGRVELVMEPILFSAVDDPPDSAEPENVSQDRFRSSGEEQRNQDSASDELELSGEQESLAGYFKRAEPADPQPENLAEQFDEQQYESLDATALTGIHETRKRNLNSTIETAEDDLTKNEFDQSSTALGLGSHPTSNDFHENGDRVSSTYPPVNNHSDSRGRDANKAAEMKLENSSNQSSDSHSLTHESANGETAPVTELPQGPAGDSAYHFVPQPNQHETLTAESKTSAFAVSPPNAENDAEDSFETQQESDTEQNLDTTHLDEEETAADAWDSRIHTLRAAEIHPHYAASPLTAENKETTFAMSPTMALVVGAAVVALIALMVAAAVGNLWYTRKSHQRMIAEFSDSIDNERNYWDSHDKVYRGTTTFVPDPNNELNASVYESEVRMDAARARQHVPVTKLWSIKDRAAAKYNFSNLENIDEES